MFNKANENEPGPSPSWSNSSSISSFGSASIILCASVRAASTRPPAWSTWLRIHRAFQFNGSWAMTSVSTSEGSGRVTSLKPDCGQQHLGIDGLCPLQPDQIICWLNERVSLFAVGFGQRASTRRGERPGEGPGQTPDSDPAGTSQGSLRALRLGANVISTTSEMHHSEPEFRRRSVCRR